MILKIQKKVLIKLDKIQEKNKKKKKRIKNKKNKNKTKKNLKFKDQLMLYLKITQPNY